MMSVVGTTELCWLGPEQKTVKPEGHESRNRSEPESVSWFHTICGNQEVSLSGSGRKTSIILGSSPFAIFQNGLIVFVIAVPLLIPIIGWIREGIRWLAEQF